MSIENENSELMLIMNFICLLQDLINTKEFQGLISLVLVNHHHQSNSVGNHQIVI